MFDHGIRRRLIISVPHLKCWLVTNGTIIGIGQDGNPDSVVVPGVNIAADTSNSCLIMRNDFPKAEKVARLTAAWAFEQRKSLNLSFAMSDSVPGYATIGTLIRNVVDTKTTVCNTLVEEIRYHWNIGSPSISIVTTVPPPPQFRGASGGPSPTSGGAVSVSLGGTVPQAVASLQEKVADIQKDAQKVAIIAPTGGSGSSSHAYALIIDVGNLLSDATTHGIKFTGSISTVPSLYDPNVTSTFIDGIGRATLYIDGVAQSGYVLVVNDGRSGTLINKALFQGDRCESLGSVSIPLVSDATKSVAVYIPYFA